MTNNTPKKQEPSSPRKTYDSLDLEVLYRPGGGWVYVFENKRNQTVNGDKVAKIWRESMER